MARKDGYRLKDCSPFYEMVPNIMPERVDATNYFEQDVDFEAIQSYVNECRQKGINMLHMSIVIAALARTTARNPNLNRFVMNKKIYGRNHLCACFVSLNGDKSDETVNKVYFNLDDDIFQINEKVQKAVEVAKSVEGENSMDKILKKVMKLGGLVSAGVSFIKWVDKHFGLPFSVVDASPFHASFFVTNLASLRFGPVYHHIYNFGTVGMFVAMGTPEKKLYKAGGEIKEKKVQTLKMSTDERIADGYYFARCFKEINKYLKNPKLLEEKPVDAVYDPNIKKKNPKFIVR
ncbi:MAG: 2-oxo acid dehydrogenase subunit E2 [Clostridia bacterium]|nr:2-oxo acid dehydrogenase subunit E2 [Clostridia bacterium]